MTILYTSKERFYLYSLAIFSIASLNTVFVYTLLFNRTQLFAALENPIALVFIVEAILLMFALAYFLTKWKVSQISGKLFIALALLGSLGFALPVAMLWKSKNKGSS